LRDILVQLIDREGPLADREGRRRHDRWDLCGKAGAVEGKFSIEVGRLARDFLAMKPRHSLDDGFRPGGLHGPNTGHPLPQPLTPEPPIRVQHDFHGAWVT